MKKPSNGALAAARSDRRTRLLLSEPTVLPLKKSHRPLKISSHGKRGGPYRKKNRPYILVKSSAEQIRDFLFLVAAILIISIIHRYAPNRGAVPHSIVDVVKSTALFQN